MTDTTIATNAAVKPLREWPIYITQQDGSIKFSHVQHVHESRTCGNCHAQCEKLDEGAAAAYCTTLEELLPSVEWVCSEHASLGEHRFGIMRPEASVDAPSPGGVPAAWLEGVAWMERVVKAEGEAALHAPENEIKFASMLLIAPDDYYAVLEKQAPGSAAPWRNWARDRMERHDYPAFFEGLRKIGEAVDLRGEEAVHGNPEYAHLFADLMLCAPPRFKAEAERILAPLIPKATHVNDDGEPVFSLAQLSETLGEPVEKLEAFVDEHIDPTRLHRGPTHPIQ